MIARICAVVVTFHPRREQMEALMTAITPQVDHVVVVDNSGDNQEHLFSAFVSDQVSIFRNDHNLGLSAAQNIGIRWAMDHRYDYVLLLDQDSVPAVDMVEKLLFASESLQKEGIKVAAVGPRYRRNQGGATSGFVQFSKGVSAPIVDGQGALWTECSFLIASGMLIATNTITTVGLMEDDFFIDHIDTEWCLRALSMGYLCYGVFNAIMTHELGKRSVSFWWIRKRTIAIHQPFRLYYMFRNSVVLYRRKYATSSWRRYEFKRLLLFPLMYLAFSDKKWMSLKYMASGVKDGMLGHMDALKH